NSPIDKFLKRFKINHHYLTPYYLQTNGLVERFNKTLCESIAKLVNNKRDWNLLISSILFAYRTAKQNTTKMTPFYLVYGRESRLSAHPNKLEELLDGTFLQYLFELIKVVPQARAAVVERVENAQRIAKI
ncbi:19509_t:CDS:1, partial [Gigaspora rosea]